MVQITHIGMDDLKASMAHILDSPKDRGELKLLVRRPQVDERETLLNAELNQEEGLGGDSWQARGSSSTPNGSAHPDAQLTIMNARVIALLAGEVARWPLAGDQLYIDLVLSEENLPPGTRLPLGEAVIQVTGLPHTGCKKFSDRFGVDALKFVNSPEGRKLNLRGINAIVIQPGRIQVGDIARVVESG
jgi:hypothetical protein